MCVKHGDSGLMLMNSDDSGIKQGCHTCVMMMTGLHGTCNLRPYLTGGDVAATTATDQSR